MVTHSPELMTLQMNINIPYHIIHVIKRNSEMKNLFDGQLEDSF